MPIRASWFFFLFFGCSLPSWLKKWQKEYLEKRYGTKIPSKEEIAEWEKEVLEYEEEIERKIRAGMKAGLLYRKIGEAYMEFKMFPLCIKNLKKAIEFGYTEADVFFSLGLCQANWARIHNWKYELVKEAEETFLKILNLYPRYSKAKFQLSLLYFYGFGSNNPYRVLNTYLTIPQIEFRKKAISLMKEYQREMPQDHRSYFALAGYYRILGENELAKRELKKLIALLEEKYPESYQDLEIYQKAQRNLQILGGR